MKRLHEPNREGGYPVTGEALEILGVDIPAYINAILEQITPSNSVVFLDSIYAYVKKGSYKEIMRRQLRGISQAQLLAGASSTSTITETNYSDTVGGTTYTDTRCDCVITIASSLQRPIDSPTFYTLESLLKKKLFDEVDYFNQIVISAPDASNVTLSGHAILKGGIVDILLGIEYTGYFQNATITLPDALSTPIPIVTNAVQNIPEEEDKYPKVILSDTEIHLVEVIGDGPGDGYAISIHFQYMPITPTAQ